MTNFLIDADEWLQPAERIRSPNFDARPPKTKISLIVVHGISLPPGEYGGGYIQQFFCNHLDTSVHPYFDTIQSLRVSAHCLIERDGNVVQFVSFRDRAWHAGKSQWCGVSACNDYSIGIELEGCDEEAYSDTQYHQLAGLAKALRERYADITADAITGHSDIAPRRKTDPGPAFDWSRLRGLLSD